jgi:hypothetical protein
MVRLKNKMLRGLTLGKKFKNLEIFIAKFLVFSKVRPSKTKLLSAPYWLAIAVLALTLGLAGASTHTTSTNYKLPTTSYQLVAATPGGCGYHQFFGLLPWYYYLPCNKKTHKPQLHFTKQKINNGKCADKAGSSTGCGLNGGPQGLGAIWLIVLAVFEDVLRIGGLLAVFMIIYGGIRYTTSSGDPQDTKGAQSTIINALIGLTIVVIAAASVAFIARAIS